MLPSEVQRMAGSIDAQAGTLKQATGLAVNTSGPNAPREEELQSVASDFLYVASAGLVEKGVQSILGAYARENSSESVASYVVDQLGYLTSLNSRDVANLLGSFDMGWKREIDEQVEQEVKDSVNTIKAVRNNIAHGESNSSGFGAALKCYGNAKIFLERVSVIVR